MTARAAALILAIAPAASGKPPPPPAPAKRIELRVVARGEVTRVSLTERTLTVRTTAADGVVKERVLTEAERAELLAAARAAEKCDDVRRSCSAPDEPFVALTIDGKTLATAVCPPSRPGREDYFAPWRALIDTAARLAAATER